MKIEIFLEGVDLPFGGITKTKIRNWARKAGAILSVDKHAAAIILTDNTYIQNINRTYRNKNRPTDVITFAYRENPFPEISESREHLGDIYISLEQTELQSREYGVSIEDEFKRLLVHGILHLFGYDHERSSRDDEIMRKRENEILESLH